MDAFRRRRKRSKYVLPLVVLLIAAGGAGWYFLVGSSESQDAPPVSAADPAYVTAETPAEPVSPVSEPEVQPIAEQAVEAPAQAEQPQQPAIAEPPTPAEQVPPVVAEAQEQTPAPAPALPINFDPGTAMAEAQKLMNSGDLVAAREALNPAIASAQLPESELKLAMQLQEQINETLVFSPRIVPADKWVDSYVLKPGDILQRIAPRYSITPGLIQRINNIPDPRRIRAGQTIKVINGPFHAVVTKSAFKMDIYLGAPGGEGSVYVCTLPVGLGMDDSTPVGTWQVEPGKKLTNPKYYSPRGEGVIEPDDPTNPLGEFWIGLVGIEGEAVGKTSYGIHGTIEPETIGKMASLGCIRMLHDDVALVFDLLVEGKSTVVVKP